MPYFCAYYFCEHEKIKAINEPVACSKCANKKPYHHDCFNKHNSEKHNGKAKAKLVKEIYTK